ncbi:MAG: hypothetical protein ACP5F6_02650 [Microbacter sp.]
MKARILFLSVISLIVGILLSSCSTNSVSVSKPPLVIGQPISAGSTLSGNVKGTMLSGQTYTMTGNITVNEGDTLLLQPGVHLKVGRGLTILVKGVFISLGTKDNPNWIGPDKSFAKTDQVGYPVQNDSAYVGYWTGINCEPSCPLVDIKWTHVDYTGASFPANFFPTGKSAGATSFGIYFQNINGNFIFEDSWMYGTIDDAIRIAAGKFELMRNTFEKCGYTGGDVINVKSGAVGDMAYNLFVGAATNSTKAAMPNSTNVQTNVTMYNNTYINGGYRQKDPTGRGGSLNYESGAKGAAFNNLIVNCRVGLRIHNNPAADVQHMKYGYNYSYGDSLSVCNMFYPVPPTTSVTVPQPTDIPTPPASIFPASLYSAAYLYQLDASGNCIHMDVPYDGSSFVQKGNPLFVNFPLPEAGIRRLSDISAVGNFNFKLQNGSPAAGKGTIDPSLIAPLMAVQISDPNLKPTITMPGVDMGCYQLNGSGNQH